MQVVVTPPIEAPFQAPLALAVLVRTEARGPTSEACLDVCCCLTTSSYRLSFTVAAWTSEEGEFSFGAALPLLLAIGC